MKFARLKSAQMNPRTTSPAGRKGARPRRAATWLVALLAAALLGAVTPAPSLAAPFSFVALGDSRGESHSQPINVKVLSAMVAKIATLKPRPALVIFAGDLVIGHRHGQGLARQLRLWRQVVSPLAGLGIRVYAVPGNHEIQGPGAAEREKVCRQALGRLQYALQEGGSAFIGLNTDRAGHPHTADLAWLGRQLEAAAAAGAEHVFVFGHEPAYPTSGREGGLRNPAGLWDLLTRYRADAYICGHEHLYSRCSRSGVLQVTTGGAGAPFYPIGGAEGFDAVEPAHHLTVWRVDGPRVEVKVLAYEASSPVAWHQLDTFAYAGHFVPRAGSVAAQAAGAAAASGQ